MIQINNIVILFGKVSIIIPIFEITFISVSSLFLASLEAFVYIFMIFLIIEISFISVSSL